MPSPILCARGVRKEYFRKGRSEARSFAAVDGVDIGLQAGSLVALTGRSGSGKSTLLNMLAGLVEPTEGEVVLDGQSLYTLSDAELSKLRNAEIGVIPQGQTPLHSLSVVENVKLPYLMYQHDDGADERAMQLLERFGIAALSECRPFELSGGELRRMAIARALMCAPRVLLADEPTGDLDDVNTEVVLRALRDAADEGAAVLVVTHEQSVADFADEVLRLDSGRLAS